MIKYVAILLGLGALANSALAMGEAVAEVDTNGDGVMSLDEVQAVYPDVTAEQFNELDSNGDGTLDDAEMVAGKEAGVIPTDS